jgi:hypothetical protein
MAVFEELSPSLRLYLRAEAARRNMNHEALLAEILAGRNPLPPHISELIREILRSQHKRAFAE